MVNSAIHPVGGRYMSSKLNSGVCYVYTCGGAAWGMLTGKGRYGVAGNTERTISERVSSVREDVLYKSTLPLLTLPRKVLEFDFNSGQEPCDRVEVYMQFVVIACRTAADVFVAWNSCDVSVMQYCTN